MNFLIPSNPLLIALSPPPQPPRLLLNKHFELKDTNHRKAVYWSVSTFILLPCVPIKIKQKKPIKIFHLIRN